MMCTRFRFFLWGLALACCPVFDAAAAHPDNAITFYARELATSPTIDGVIGASEYSGVRPVHISYVETPDPNNPDFGIGSNPGFILPNRDYHKGWGNTDADMSVDVYTAFTSSSLILAFRAYDDILDIQDIDATSPWENDSLEIFINPDLDDSDFIPSNRESTYEAFQYIIDAAGHTLVGGANTQPPEATVAATQLSDGYIIEVSMPLDQLDVDSSAAVVPASKGSVMRWTLGQTDNDRPLDDNQDVYGWLWREPGDGSPFGMGEPGWHAKLVLGNNPADLNGDGSVDAADAGIMFGEWTGDPAVPAKDAATAEYNAATGVLKLSAAGPINVYVQSASGAITPVNPAPAVPAGLVTNNKNRVGVSNLGPITLENFNFGNIGAGLGMGDLTLIYTPGFGKPEVKIAAGAAGFRYIPEPSSVGMIVCGLAGLLAARRGRR